MAPITTDFSTAPGAEGDLPPEHKEILNKVRERMEASESVHKPYRDRWNIYYGLYRNYRRLVSAHSTAENDSDRAQILADGQRAFGEPLFVPYVFATLETIVPRALSNDPKMLVRPRTPDARESAAKVQELLNEQQLEVSYDQKLQPVARSGFKYGLGVQKTFWHREARKVLRVAPKILGRGQQVIEEEVVLREGPDQEWVDIWDFFWDPAARDIETCSYVIHRTWRPYEYIKEKVESGEWLPINLERIKGRGSAERRNENWAERMQAAGMAEHQIKHGDLHEVWEYHDRENVYTILNNALVVQAKKAPYFHRELPFQIYRPTPQEGEFVGIGEIEPIAHLQHELNLLRQQRRDNATMVLQKAFMYAEGRVRPEDLKIGPGIGIPVLGSPREDIVPLEFPEIPASGYREEEALKLDIERTTGVSDPVAGGTGSPGGAAETATGVQLVQQAANVRIRLKTKNLERELIRPAGRQWLELNRQFFTQPRPVRITDPGTEEGFRFVETGPKDLMADLDDPIPDAGSTEPDNPLERQQKAIQIYNNLSGNPAVDQRHLIAYLLREFDVRDHENFLMPENPTIDPRLIAAALEQLGVPQEIILEATQLAMEADVEAEAEMQGGEQPVPSVSPPE